MEKKKKGRWVYINFWISLVALVPLTIWAIIMTTIDFEAEMLASKIAMVLVGIGIIYFMIFAIWSAAMVLSLRVNVKPPLPPELVDPHPDIPGSRKQPEAPVSKVKRSMFWVLIIELFLLIIFIVSICLMYALVSSTWRLVASLVAALMAGIGVIGFHDYGSHVVREVEAPPPVEPLAFDRAPVYLMATTFLTGRPYILYQDYTSFYLIRWREGMDPGEVDYRRLVVEDPKSYRVDFRDVKSLVIVPGFIDRGSGPEATAFSVKLKARRNFRLMIPDSRTKSEVDAFFRPLVRVNHSERVRSRREEVTREQLIDDQMPFDFVALDRLGVALRALALVASIICFGLWPDLVVVFILLSLLFATGMVLQFVWRRYYVLYNERTADQERRGGRSKIGVGVLVFAPLMVLMFRALVDFQFLDIGPFFLYSALLFVFIALVLTPLVFRQRLIIIRILTYCCLLVYAPCFIAYTNVIFTTSTTEYVHIVVDKEVEGSEYKSYYLVYEVEEKRQKVTCSWSEYRLIEIGDQIKVVEAVGLYQIRYRYLNEDLS